MAYILFLTENRKLEWIVSFNILVKLFREPSNYSCKTVLNLKPIFLGRKHSPVQVIQPKNKIFLLNLKIIFII